MTEQANTEKKEGESNGWGDWWHSDRLDALW